MDINRDNYEIFFLDHIEGNLDAEQEEILQRFLKFNPDLAEELNQFSEKKLESDTVLFSGKEALKKSVPKPGDRVSYENFDMFAVAYLEQDLDSEQRESFLALLDKHPELAAELELFRKTSLPVEHVAYPGKKGLKRGRIISFGWQVLAPVAVAATLALFLLFKSDPVTMEPTFQVADVVEPENNATVEDEPEETAVPVKSDTSTPSLKIIKNTQSRMPRSDYNPAQEQSGEKTGDTPINKKPERSRIAGISLSERALATTIPEPDEIVPISIDVIGLNPESLSLTQRARLQLNKAAEIAEEEDVLIWRVASSGLNGINRLAGTDMKLLASKTDEGSISGISFRSRLLNVTTPISREEE